MWFTEILLIDITHRLAAGQKGAGAPVGGNYPRKRRPMVGDLNALLDAGWTHRCATLFCSAALVRT